MIPKHASVVVCSACSVISGAFPLATEYNHCPVPVTISGKILQLTAGKLCWLLTIHLLPEVKERHLLWSCWVCLVWLSEHHFRHEFIIKTKVQAENDNSMKIFVKNEMPIYGSGFKFIWLFNTSLPVVITDWHRHCAYSVLSTVLSIYMYLFNFHNTLIH